MGAGPRKSHRLNVSGDFWVDDNCCMRCGVPDAEPDLFGVDDTCYVKKQPSTPDELERMLTVIATAEADCIRYRGRDPEIRGRLGASVCDPPSGRWWERLRSVFRGRGGGRD